VSNDKKSDSLKPEEIHSNIRRNRPYQRSARHDLTERLHLLFWDPSP